MVIMASNPILQIKKLRSVGFDCLPGDKCRMKRNFSFIFSATLHSLLMFGMIKKKEAFNGETVLLSGSGRVII